MKVLVLVFVAVVGLAAFLLWFGGVFDLNPKADADTFRKTVKPGMDWKQVVDLQAPKRVIPLREDLMSGEGPAVPFNQPEVAKAIQNGGYGVGFIFRYQFTGRDVVSVVFSPQGKVQAVQNEMTFMDLAEGKAFKQ